MRRRSSRRRRRRWRSATGVGWSADGKSTLCRKESPRGAPYRLHAYLDGRSYSVDAQDFGDWYDAEQVLGLLNAIAKDRGEEMRLLPLDTGDQTLCVLAAPKTAIVAGVAAGLFEAGSAGAGRESGQAFEQAVGRMLESGELELPSQE